MVNGSYGIFQPETHADTSYTVSPLPVKPSDIMDEIPKKCCLDCPLEIYLKCRNDYNSTNDAIDVGEKICYKGIWQNHQKEKNAEVYQNMSLIMSFITPNGLWMISESRSTEISESGAVHYDNYKKIMPVFSRKMIVGSVGLNIFGNKNFEQTVGDSIDWAENNNATDEEFVNRLKFSMYAYAQPKQKNTLLLIGRYVKTLGYGFCKIQCCDLDKAQYPNVFDDELDLLYTPVYAGAKLGQAVLARIKSQDIADITVNEEFAFVANKFKLAIELDNKIDSDATMGGPIVGYHLDGDGNIMRMQT